MEMKQEKNVKHNNNKHENYLFPYTFPKIARFVIKFTAGKMLQKQQNLKFSHGKHFIQ